jgi:hypothetical protein
MVFRRSRHFPGGEIVERMQKLATLLTHSLSKIAALNL